MSRYGDADGGSYSGGDTDSDGGNSRCGNADGRGSFDGDCQSVRGEVIQQHHNPNSDLTTHNNNPSPFPSHVFSLKPR